MRACDFFEHFKIDLYYYSDRRGEKTRLLSYSISNRPTLYVYDKESARSSSESIRQARQYIDAKPGVAEDICTRMCACTLVRAVFITNYRPRTGFMTPQKREKRGGPKRRLYFAWLPF